MLNNPVSACTDAVTRNLLAAVGEGKFAQRFNPERLFLPTFELEAVEAQQLMVKTAPSAIEIDTLNRGANQIDVNVDVGVMLKLNGKTPEYVDPMEDLVCAIQLHLADFNELVNDQTAACIKVTCDPLFSRKHLLEQSIFLSVSTFQIRTFK